MKTRYMRSSEKARRNRKAASTMSTTVIACNSILDHSMASNKSFLGTYKLGREE